MGRGGTVGRGRRFRPGESGVVEIERGGAPPKCPAVAPFRATMSEPSTTWGAGEYALIAERLEPAAHELVELADVASLTACSISRAGQGTPR